MCLVCVYSQWRVPMCPRGHLCHGLNELVDVLLAVAVVASLGEGVCLLLPASSRVVELEWPQEVRHLGFENTAIKHMSASEGRWSSRAKDQMHPIFYLHHTNNTSNVRSPRSSLPPTFSCLQRTHSNAPSSNGGIVLFTCLKFGPAVTISWIMSSMQITPSEPSSASIVEFSESGMRDLLIWWFGVATKQSTRE